MEIKEKILKDIRLYCSINGIDDVEGFMERCLVQGFNIVRFGTSPMDNIARQMIGTKDLGKGQKHEEDISRQKEGESAPRIEETSGGAKEEGLPRQEGEEPKVQGVKRKVKIVKRS